MSKVTVTKTSFTSGEIDPALYGRIDLRAYEDGAATLRNVLVKRTGGVSRRSGSEFLGHVASGARMFSYDLGDVHDLLVFGDAEVHVLQDGTPTQTIGDAPWSIDEVGQVNMTLVDDAVLVCHKDHEPRLLRRGVSGLWSSATLTYAKLSEDDSHLARPFARFASADVAVQATRIDPDEDPTSVAGATIEVTASPPIFDENHIDTVLRIKGRQVRVLQLSDPDGATVLAMTLDPLVDELTTVDWDEQAFSTVHGWPIAAAMHQNRLVLGGCRDRPDYLWFSRSGRPFDFDMAAGEDDAAIAFRLGGERRHEVRQLFSGRVLQVFTTGGEWTVDGYPLTPRTAAIELQTGVGSLADRQVQPVDVDGATLFVGSTGRDLREFLFTDTEQAYQAADIAILSRHLMRDPVDMAFDQARRVFWIVRGDGRCCAVTIDRNSNIVAWTLQETDGDIRAVVMHAGALVMLVERASGLFVERLDERLTLDSTRRFIAESPTQSWSGLDSLVGESVYLIADGEIVGEIELQAGQIQLPISASTLEVGFGFAHAVEGLPLISGSGRAVAVDAPYRPVRISMRLGPTRSLLLDAGSGLRPISFGRASGLNDVFDVSLRARGWRRGTGATPWRLAQTEPGACDLLSVTVEAKVNG